MICHCAPARIPQLSPRAVIAPSPRATATPAAAPAAGAMHRARPALWAAALITLALLRGPPGARAGVSAVGAGPVVRCEPCDARALAQCAPPPTAPACAELVREPGCGCCLTCALREGQACGVYTERCGSGLRCQPQPDEPRPLHALLHGRGFCANASAAGRLHSFLLPASSAPGEPPSRLWDPALPVREVGVGKQSPPPTEPPVPRARGTIRSRLLPSVRSPDGLQSAFSAVRRFSGREAGDPGGRSVGSDAGTVPPETACRCRLGLRFAK